MLYKLTRNYWDGRIEHRMGSIVDFEEGKAPKGSVPYAPEPEPVPEPAKAKSK